MISCLGCQAFGTALAAGRTSDATLRHMAGILGYIAFGAMVASFLWGMALGGRMLSRRVRRATLYGGHLTLATIALTTSTLHGLIHLFRHDEHYGWAAILLPWVGGADAVVSLGILGLEIVLVVAVSIWLQRRLSYRRWLQLHRFAYPGFVLIAAHVVLASRERSFSPLVIAIVVALGLVAVVAAARTSAAPEPVPDVRWFDVVEEQRR